VLTAVLERAGLVEYRRQAELWEIEGSSRQLATLTHGLFRYFGKFPPPVAERLVFEYTGEGDLVLDPAVGSGTTLVESARLGRASLGRDVLPLALLVAKVKTTPVDSRELLAVADAVVSLASREWMAYGPDSIPRMRGMDHWYWPSTAARLAALSQAIEASAGPGDITDALRVVLATVSRRYSRSSHALPRQFLEPSKSSESQENLFDYYLAETARVGRCLESLGKLAVWVRPRIELRDIRHPTPTAVNAKLAIFHPPYFNVYRYSSIYRFEGTWLGSLPARGSEIREGFKQGNPQLLDDYVNDVAAGFKGFRADLASDAKVALMIGDTEIRSSYIQTVRAVLKSLECDRWRVERILVRVPRHTEASYKTAQRRSTDDLGPRFKDFVVVLTSVR
jgi:hypothetical protein